jgi:hypothetical protein
MLKATKECILQLEQVSWFSKAGIADSDQARFVKSWSAAIRKADSLEWENLKLELKNRLVQKIAAVSESRSRQWNKTNSKMRPLAVKFSELACSNLTLEEKDRKALTDTVRWDILNLLMEMEFSDIVPPSFYAGLAF